MSGLPPEAFVAALAGLPSISVHRLGALLRHHEPEEAWQVVLGHAPPRGLMAKVLADPTARQGVLRHARAASPERVWERCADIGCRVLLHGAPDYPEALQDDPLPPAALFVLGSLDLLAGRRVAVVGTRNATAAGREAARALGAGLGTAGVHVVSGLARGIDGCVHRGVLAAEGPGRPIGVVACGLDVVYPREHRDLWSATANCGLLLSEMPPGVAPEPFRFPLRNRIVAALAEVVVVVESREKGGSLLTANDALDRGVPVMAVPGSPSNRAAAGSNALLRDGAAPVLDAGDVLTALQLDHRLARSADRAEARRRPDRAERVVYEVLRGEPRTLEGVALAAGVDLVDAAVRLGRLQSSGWVAQADGWFEVVGSPLR
ncbi:MAG: processing protein DprA [Actinomycetota bacterium]